MTRLIRWAHHILTAHPWYERTPGAGCWHCADIASRRRLGTGAGW